MFISFINKSLDRYCNNLTVIKKAIVVTCSISILYLLICISTSSRLSSSSSCSFLKSSALIRSVSSSAVWTCKMVILVLGRKKNLRAFCDRLLLLTYLANKVGIDVNLGLVGSGSALGCDNGPGGVDGLHFEVQLVELVVGEDVISVSPSSSQLIKQGPNLSRLHFRTREGLK